jgi:PAS domain S-box-containing protein
MKSLQEKADFMRSRLADEDHEKILFQVIETCHAPMTITDHRDPEEPIIYCNQAFEKLSGYEADEILGKNCRFLQGEDTDQTQIDIINDALENNKFADVTIKNYRKDGTAFWNQLLLYPIGSDDAPKYYLGMQVRVSDLSDTE